MKVVEMQCKGGMRGFGNAVSRLLFCSFFLSLWVVAFPAQASAVREDYKILVLHSYHQGYKWTADEHQAFNGEIKKQLPKAVFQIHAEYLDTKRRTLTPSYIAFFSDYLLHKYEDFVPDLIYATDDNALIFSKEIVKSTYPSVPIVFSGVNDLSHEEYRSSMEDGVFERLQLKDNLEFIKKAYPKQKRILFVGDSSFTYHNMKKSILLEMKESFPELNAVFVAERRFDKVLNRLQKMPPAPLLLTTIGRFTDHRGRVVPLPRALNDLGEIGDFPIFVMEDTYLHSPAVGGWVNSGRSHGKAAAQIGARILSGSYNVADKSPSYPAEPIFDYRSLKAAGISLDLLPRGTTLLNEPTELFYTHKRLVIVVLVASSILLIIIVYLWLNVRKRQRAEAKLEASSRQNYMLFEKAPEGILLLDKSGLVLDINQRTVEMLGYTKEQFAKFRVQDFDLNTDLDKIKENFNKLQETDPLSFESVYRNAEGETFPVNVRATRCQWDAHMAMLYFVQDISDRKEAEEQLQEKEERLNFLAFHDPLTSLPNRLLFGDRLEHALALASRNATRLDVMFLDLDRFKTINDSLGHVRGDQVLKEVARRLKDTVRETDTLARLGGDEFVILLEGCENDAVVESLAEKILDIVKPPIEMATGDIYLTASLGISSYPAVATTPQEMMIYADVAMYKAKEARDTYRFYHSEKDAEAAGFLQIESDLRRAIDKEEFVLHYQPQYDLEKGCLIGMEALLRWEHPENGLTFPGAFIDLAEENGLIVPIGEWVLREACRQQRVWIDQGREPVPVAVNISPKQFRLPQWHEIVARTLEEYGLDASLMELEITENLLMENTEQAIETMENLSKLGISIAIDDFGSGYSSMAYLKRFPIKKLKIDRSFVFDMEDSVSDASIISAVVTLGWSLGLKVVAEGIERDSQLAYLKDQGCHHGQGYLLGRPIDAMAMAKLLDKPLMLERS